MLKYQKYNSQDGLLSSYNYNYNSSISTSNELLKNGQYFRIRFRHVAVITVSLPIAGFFFCIFWAIYYDFEGSTRTHCGVPNYLPSLSAAIGDYEFSETIWKLCIGLHAVPRFVIAGIYFNYLSSIIHVQYIPIILTTCAFYILENIGLVLLTLVSSDLNFEFHKNCFILFMASSLVYMTLSCLLLNSKSLRNIPPNSIELNSLWFKKSLFTINVIFIFLTCYTYYRHNKYCEPGMYTIFALFEYIVILSNMAFHMTAYLDFYDKVWTI